MARSGEEPRGMNENEIATNVLNAAFKIHTKLGPGLLESVYETVLAYELAKLGFTVRRQVPIPIRYEECSLKKDFVPTCS